ncbi:MAG: hypothetical protein KatS3mg002_0646 [Candidatus Woesearchaeota archaeon]|nr:MAG: hypothetical protein KatS3mg002_0646 [Candidatus Woesearchaeota archaeon]
MGLFDFLKKKDSIKNTNSPDLSSLNTPIPKLETDLPSVKGDSLTDLSLPSLDEFDNSQPADQLSSIQNTQSGNQYQGYNPSSSMAYDDMNSPRSIGASNTNVNTGHTINDNYNDNNTLRQDYSGLKAFDDVEGYENQGQFTNGQNPDFQQGFQTEFQKEFQQESSQSQQSNADNLVYSHSEDTPKDNNLFLSDTGSKEPDWKDYDPYNEEKIEPPTMEDFEIKHSEGSANTLELEETHEDYEGIPEFEEEERHISDDVPYDVFVKGSDYGKVFSQIQDVKNVLIIQEEASAKLTEKFKSEDIIFNTCKENMESIYKKLILIDKKVF